MVTYNTAESAMDNLFNWIMNSPNNTMVSMVVSCNYSGESVSGSLNAGAFLLVGYRRHTYANITAYSYWNSRSMSIATIEDNSWTKRFDRVITNTDLRFYSTTNGITKIASLPWGIYNLQDSEVRALTDKPSELNQGRAIIITSGLSTNDEKVALILASSGRDGGVYFGYVWGSNTPEFSWKKIIGNNA